MDKILIVPDVHGRKFWEPALEYDGQVVFLGDYTDPYSYEGFYDKDAYEAIFKIIAFKKANPERVTLLIGNHEFHYFDEKYEAGRFSYDYYERFHELLTGEATADLFQLCKQIDNYLFIHAGIVKEWYERHLAEIQQYEPPLENQMNMLFKHNKDVFYEASFRRGGPNPSGSPLWADVHEIMDEKEHFDNNIVQIFGHTQIRGNEPIHGDKFWMLDNRQLYWLFNDTVVKYAELLEPNIVAETVSEAQVQPALSSDEATEDTPATSSAGAPSETE
jgi:hypothetical protein